MRRYKGSGKLTKEVIEKAIDECIEQEVLVDILAKQRAEVIGVVLTSFNQEAYDEDLLSEGFQKGFSEGTEYGEKIGEERGTQKGIEQMSRLIQKLLSEGRTEDIERVTTDEQYRKQLIKEYGLDQSE